MALRIRMTFSANILFGRNMFTFLYQSTIGSRRASKLYLIINPQVKVRKRKSEVNES